MKLHQAPGDRQAPARPAFPADEARKDVWHRLWLRLLLGYLLVAIAAVGLVAIVATRSTTRQFLLYVSQGRQARAQRLAPEFAAYYAQTGSWEGVDDRIAKLALVQPGGQGQGRRQGRGGEPGDSPDRLILADRTGQVLADSQGKLIGQRLSDEELSNGAAIEVGGQVVGTLLIPSPATAHTGFEGEFLARVNRSLLWAGLAAGLLAIILSLLLVRKLTAPLRELTLAVRRLAEYRPAPNTAQGTPLSPPEDVPQVEVRSQDEIGELSQAFNQMARSLAQQEMLRRNLMADIAHELRTPLTILRSDLEALLDGVYEPTPEALASLHEETLLLSRLVDDLRALAQAEAGQLRLECQSTDLLELLRGVVTSFDLQAENDGIALALDLPASLPAVQVDPQRLHQVVANLVSNALRHARAVPAVDHGPTARQPAPGQVIVAATQHSDYVQVSVSDNGPGIRSEDVPHVFDRFWRGDWVATPRSPEESKTSASKARGSTSRRSGRSEEYLPESQDFVRSGSGLGLAIAQELVQAHGGRIWAESVPGQGATLHFTLPVRPTG